MLRYVKLIVSLNIVDSRSISKNED